MNFTQNPKGKYDGYCIIKSLEKKITSKGAPYLSLRLSDSDGEIEAQWWDYHEEPGTEFRAFDFVKEEGAEAIYLPRTPEISTTQIKQDLRDEIHG